MKEKVLAFLGINLEKMKAIDREWKEEQRVKGLQAATDAVVENIRYIQDPRTGLCFAYYWWSDVRGEYRAIAGVPIESVPPHLLTVAQVK